MRIRSIDLFLNRQPFQLAFTSLHKDRREASGVLLRLEADSGMVGWGESTPRSYVTGETCATVVALIERRLAPLLLSGEWGDTDQLRGLLEALERAAQRPCPVAASSALGAVDLALWDLWGKACGKPVTAFFVCEPSSLPELSLSVPILPPDQLQRLYPLASGMGVTRFKVVLSADTEENASRLSMLRRLAGPQALISVDANGKLPADRIAAMLPELLPYGISALEQPAPKDDLVGLRRLRECVSRPITLDESVCTLTDARRAIEGAACDTINLKISKCGGLLATRSIHTLARRHGIGCQLGSHVGETPILEAAGQAAARMLPDLGFMEIGSALLDPCAALRPPHAPPAAPPQPGLGLSIDTEVVATHFGAPVLTLRAPS